MFLAVTPQVSTPSDCIGEYAKSYDCQCSPRMSNFICLGYGNIQKTGQMAIEKLHLAQHCQ